MTVPATNGTSDLPVVVIGAGPVGLAAAAHLAGYALSVVVLEAGDRVGAAMRAWGHVRTFTPWRYIIDPAAEKLLAPTGWTAPEGELPPTGGEIVSRYLEPLAHVLGERVGTGRRVLAVSRDGLDKTHTIGRAQRPLLVRVLAQNGLTSDLRAAAVIDASGTWGLRNPLGGSGLPAHGEAEATAAGVLLGPLPDVLGRDRARFAGRRTLVVGAGHSAATTLLQLARLAAEEPGTRIVWAIRGTDPARLYGGGADDELPARGRLGTDLRALVDTGAVELVTGFATTGLELNPGARAGADGAATGRRTVTITGATGNGPREVADVDVVVAATGFRPDLSLLGEVLLDLDPALEAPRALAPLIDPQVHSCGTVPPHGHRDLAHPDPGLFIAGTKAYGRAPTFLIATGNEQVRSIAAHLAGDHAAADRVELSLPETGVCSTTPPDAGTSGDIGTSTAEGAGCCGSARRRQAPAPAAPASGSACCG